MPDSQDRTIDDVMELLAEQGPAGMAAVFTRLFNLAMRFERERQSLSHGAVSAICVCQTA